jgi:hypothetical protein
MESIDLKDNELLRQYQAEIEGTLVTLEYSDQGRKIFLTKLVIAEKLREKGYIDPFLKAVVDDIQNKRKIKVMPTGKDVRAFFKKNKQKYRDLLPVGINL